VPLNGCCDEFCYFAGSTARCDKSLELVASEFAQLLELFGRFNTLGDHFKLQTVANEMMAFTMDAASSCVVKSLMKLRSIFNLSMGKRRR